MKYRVFTRTNLRSDGSPGWGSKRHVRGGLTIEEARSMCSRINTENKYPNKRGKMAEFEREEN